MLKIASKLAITWIKYGQRVKTSEVNLEIQMGMLILDFSSRQESYQLPALF